MQAVAHAEMEAFSSQPQAEGSKEENMVSHEENENISRTKAVYTMLVFSVHQDCRRQGEEAGKGEEEDSQVF